MDYTRLVRKILSGEQLRADDTKALNQWAMSERGRRDMEEQLLRGLAEAGENFAAGVDYDALLRKLTEKIRSDAKRKRAAIRKRYRMAAAAAAVILVLGTTIFINNRQAGEEVIESGKNIAMLQLSDGRVITLDNNVEELVDQRGAMTVIKNGEILYTDDLAIDEVIYNKIYVPRGGEYKVVLADGSAVWLNSDTRLRYPLGFAGGERRVFLEGEAYFEVAPDPGKPFIVETTAQELTVLGTGFNVEAYGGDAKTVTTLANGSIEVSNRATGEKRTLVPGEQSQIDAVSGTLTVKTVKVQNVLAWRNGLFVFDDNDLGEIMLKVARWYDVEVRFADPEARDIVFRGNLPKYENLDTLLEMIGTISSARFEVEERTVTVSI